MCSFFVVWLRFQARFCSFRFVFIHKIQRKVNNFGSTYLNYVCFQVNGTEPKMTTTQRPQVNEMFVRNWWKFGFSAIQNVKWSISEVRCIRENGRANEYRTVQMWAENQKNRNCVIERFERRNKNTNGTAIILDVISQSRRGDCVSFVVMHKDEQGDKRGKNRKIIFFITVSVIIFIKLMLFVFFFCVLFVWLLSLWSFAFYLLFWKCLGACEKGKNSFPWAMLRDFECRIGAFQMGMERAMRLLAPNQNWF